MAKNKNDISTVQIKFDKEDEFCLSLTKLISALTENLTSNKKGILLDNNVNQINPLFIFTGPFLFILLLSTILFCKPSLALFSLFYLIIATISSLIYSRWAFEIHIVNKLGINSWYLKNQYWLNFLGHLIGWLALYYFLVARLKIFDNTDLLIAIKNLKIKLPDLGLLLTSFLGITGYLPYWALLGKGNK